MEEEIAYKIFFFLPLKKKKWLSKEEEGWLQGKLKDLFVPRKTSFTSEHIPTADQTLRGLLRVPVSWQPGTPGRSSPPCPGGGVRAERAGWARLRAQSRGEAEAEGLSTHLPRLPTPARLTQVAHLARSTQKHGQRQPRKAGCWAGFAGERGSSARGPLSLSVPWLSPEH